MKQIQITAILIITLWSCSKNQLTEHSDLIEIKHSYNQRYPVISDSIVSDLFVLKLETPKDIYIGAINKIIFSKDRIFIADNRIVNSVYIFDQYGVYINHLEGGYKGPGEFIRPQSITTDFESNELFVFDDKLQKIITYNSNGIFISEIKFKYTANDISRVNSGTFAFNSGYPQIDNGINSNDLLYITSKGNVNRKFLPLRDWRIGSIFNKDNSFCEYMDTAWYSPVYNDTIYRLSEKGPVPTFHIEMGNKFISDKIARKIDLDDPFTEYQHAIQSFIKAGEIIYFSYDIRDNESKRMVLSHVFYNTKSRNYKSGPFLSGTKNSYGLFTGPVSTTGEYFVGICEAFNLKRSLEFNLDIGKDMPEEFIELISNISEYDNPYLIFYKVAPF